VSEKNGEKTHTAARSGAVAGKGRDSGDPKEKRSDPMLAKPHRGMSKWKKERLQREREQPKRKKGFTTPRNFPSVRYKRDICHVRDEKASRIRVVRNLRDGLLKNSRQKEYGRGRAAEERRSRRQRYAIRS